MLESDHKKLIEYMQKFLVLCKKELMLDKLPTIQWLYGGEGSVNHRTFGTFNNKSQTIQIEIMNRHPVDIMRTLAHELVHYKQWTRGEINAKSGETGSKQENQAHAVAGIIMRHFDRTYPDAFNIKPVS